MNKIKCMILSSILVILLVLIILYIINKYNCYKEGLDNKKENDIENNEDNITNNEDNIQGSSVLEKNNVADNASSLDNETEDNKNTVKNGSKFIQPKKTNKLGELERKAEMNLQNINFLKERLEESSGKKIDERLTKIKTKVEDNEKNIKNLNETVENTSKSMDDKFKCEDENDEDDY